MPDARIERCFACDRVLGRRKYVVSEGPQNQHVGRECFRYIQHAGRAGWQPPKGGPRLFLPEFVKGAEP